MINALLLAMMLSTNANADTTTAVVANDVRKTNTASYSAARDTVAGNSVNSTIYLGQGAVAFPVYRGYFGFPIASVTATACSLYWYLATDVSTTDFDVYLVGARSAKSTITVDDYSRFNGRVSGGPHTGTVLNDTFSSAGKSINNWYAVVFNAAGLDSLNAAAGDTLWIAAISKEDYDNSEPAANEAMIFNGLGATAPYLSYSSGGVVVGSQYSRNKIYNLAPTPIYDKSPVPFYRGY
jgi:hypothetical protein